MKVFRVPLHFAVSDNKLQIPEPTGIANSDKTLPFVFIGDDAFALTKRFMKPYAQTGLTTEQWMFNYRPSRERFLHYSIYIWRISATYCAKT